MSQDGLQVGPVLRRTYGLAAAAILALATTAALTYFANRGDDGAVTTAFERARLGGDVQALTLERARHFRTAAVPMDEMQKADDQGRRALRLKLDSLARLDAPSGNEDALVRDLNDDVTTWDGVVASAIGRPTLDLSQVEKSDSLLRHIQDQFDELRHVQDLAFAQALNREQWQRKTRIGCWIAELILILVGLLVAHRTILRQVTAAVESQHEILDRLASASEYRDDGTGEHTQRVGELAARIARAMGHSAERAETIRRAAALHDVGKIGVPDSILLKPGRLTPEELDVIRQHTIIGARILDGGHSPVVIVAARIARHHHEWWNGAGYPDRLVGEAIPIEARITAVADVFDAIRSKRPYRDAFALEICLDEIRSGAGTHFDPAVVNAFFNDRCYEGYAVQGGESQDAAIQPARQPIGRVTPSVV